MMAEQRSAPLSTQIADAAAADTCSPEIQELLRKTEEQQRSVQHELSDHQLISSERREAARRFVLGTLLDHLYALSQLLRRNALGLSDPCLADTLDKLLDRIGELVPDPNERRVWPGNRAGLLLRVGRWFRLPGHRYDEGNAFYWHAHREAAWELAFELEYALLDLGDAQYLSARLEQERQLDSNPEGAKHWSDLYDTKKLDKIQDDLDRAEAVVQPTLRHQVVDTLTRLSQVRGNADREHRAQETLRVVRLRWTCRILAIALLAVTGLLVPSLFTDWRSGIRGMALFLAPAVLGGTLGSVRSLREEPLVSRSGEQPRYRWAFYAQLLVAATFGLIVLALAVLERLPGFQPADVNPGQSILQQSLGDPQNVIVVTIYSFLAGFSEAFTNFWERLVTGGL
jgi:hypothetical protein